ncbi:hypothetical protein EVAR_37712_1 [Eumeta japonica]|uniref:Uncharacterized protein n=1 Tax=Eumeta variegata TaxID=151549 RepID=A0A4C1XU14_EUMVA|nr:hypothetical protein EVAR_37712_1 [Eumeta japonica]
MNFSVGCHRLFFCLVNGGGQIPDGLLREIWSLGPHPMATVTLPEIRDASRTLCVLDASVATIREAAPERRYVFLQGQPVELAGYYTYDHRKTFDLECGPEAKVGYYSLELTTVP